MLACPHSMGHAGIGMTLERHRSTTYKRLSYGITLTLTVPSCREPISEYMLLAIMVSFDTMITMTICLCFVCHC